MPKIDWEIFRAEIEQLYIVEDKTLAEVVGILEATKGLNASKSSYEKKLRQWGISKYCMGQRRWNAVARIVEKRKRAGKGSDVIVRGVRIAPKKVEREISRHVTLTLRTKFAPNLGSPSPEPLDGICIRSPGPSYEHTIRGEDSPWLQFMSSLHKSGFQGVVSEAMRPGVLPKCSSSDAEISSQWPFLGLVGTLGSVRSSEHKNIWQEAQSVSWITEALSRIMPEAYLGQYGQMAEEMLLGKKSQAGSMVELFLLSNNFMLFDDPFRLGQHDAQVLALVEKIGSANPQDIKTFLSTQGFVTEAIKDKVFATVLRCGHVDILSVLLELGIDTNANPGTWAIPSPLWVSAGIRDRRVSFEMVCILLKYGARVDNFTTPSALSIAIVLDNMDVFNALTDAGALLSPCSLGAAIQAGNDVVVEKILDAGIDVNGQLPWPYISTGWSALAHAAHREYTSIVRTLVRSGADVNAVYQWVEFKSVHSGLFTTALGLAAGAEQVETVRFLALEADALTDQILVDNYICPLVIACFTGNIEIITLLLRAGADVSYADTLPEELDVRLIYTMWDGDVPKTLLELLIAHLDGDEEQATNICKELIIRGALIDRALITATREGKPEIIKLLLRHGASLDAPPQTRASAFGLAIEMGNLGLAQILYQAGATETGHLRLVKGEEMAEFLDRTGLFDGILHRYGWFILTQAIEKGELGHVERILRTEVDLRDKYTEALAAAVRCTQDIDLIETLIKRGAPVCGSVIQAFIDTDSSDTIVRRLLAEIMQPTESCCNTFKDPRDYLHMALFWAARRGSRRILGIILESVNWKPQKLGKALTSAIQHGNYGVVQDLLDAGARLGQYDFLGSALCAAIYQKQVWLVKVLIKSGADVNECSPYNATALESATTIGHMELVEVLLGEGADANVNAATRNHLTALQTASCLGHVGIARKLLDAGADVNAPGKRHNSSGAILHGQELTALVLAASQGRVEMLHLLLGRGAKIQGAARLHYIKAVRTAEMEGYRAAAGLLKSHGGWTESDELSVITSGHDQDCRTSQDGRFTSAVTDTVSSTKSRCDDESGSGREQEKYEEDEMIISELMESSETGLQDWQPWDCEHEWNTAMECDYGCQISQFQHPELVINDGLTGLFLDGWSLQDYAIDEVGDWFN